MYGPWIHRELLSCQSVSTVPPSPQCCLLYSSDAQQRFSTHLKWHSKVSLMETTNATRICYVCCVLRGVHCSVRCLPPSLSGLCALQIAGAALATTTEPHLTNRLAPAGGWGRNKHSRRLQVIQLLLWTCAMGQCIKCTYGACVA